MNKKSPKKKTGSKKKTPAQSTMPKLEYQQILMPDNPGHFEKAGWWRKKTRIINQNEKLPVTSLYFSEGKYSFYSASFFAGIVHVQMLPLLDLPDFLEEQTELDENEGIWYDKITLREGNRNFYERTFDSAEELYLWLTQYKRHGALIGEGASFDYIQVCYLQFF